MGLLLAKLLKRRYEQRQGGEFYDIVDPPTAPARAEGAGQRRVPGATVPPPAATPPPPPPPPFGEHPSGVCPTCWQPLRAQGRP